MLNDDKFSGLQDILNDIYDYQLPDSHEAHMRLIRQIRQIVDNELTDLQKKVIFAVYFENLSISQIAENLGVCCSAVSRTHKRALDRLRRYSQYLSLRS